MKNPFKRKKLKPGDKGCFKDQGDMVRAIRKAAGLRQFQLAYILGKTPNDISRYEHGYINIPGSVFMELLRIRSKGEKYVQNKLRGFKR